tara:strand:- start:160 stop:624 length:465 start_codon:yes stop_codon:yes gene_type:complete
MGFISRLGKKIKSGLILGLKVGAGAGALYLGNKAYNKHQATNRLEEERNQRVASNRAEVEALASLSDQDRKRLIEAQARQVQARLEAEPLGILQAPISQQNIQARPSSFDTSSPSVFDKIRTGVNVAERFQSGGISNRLGAIKEGIGAVRGFKS